MLTSQDCRGGIFNQNGAYKLYVDTIENFRVELEARATAGLQGPEEVEAPEKAPLFCKSETLKCRSLKVSGCSAVS